MRFQHIRLDGEVAAPVAEAGVVLAVIVNSVVKAGIDWIAGSQEMGRLVAGILAATSIAGLSLVWIL